MTKVAREPLGYSELARERRMNELLRARCPVAAERTPSVLEWEPDHGRLTMEAIDGWNLRRMVLASGHLQAAVGTEIGLLVACLHDEGAPLARETLPAALSEGTIEWHRPGPSLLRRLSLAGVALLETVQRSERLCRHLDRLVEERRPADTLVHGDLRWENVLVEAFQTTTPRVWLVDWEFAGLGEAAWDVACFLAACLGAWLSTIPHVPGVPPERLIELAEVPLEVVKPGLVSFWSAYSHARGLAGEDQTAWANRCTELVGVRLVHLALEATRDCEYLRSAPVVHLQVALNAFEDPALAAEELLGIAR